MTNPNSVPKMGWLDRVVNVEWGGGWYVLLYFNATANGANVHHINVSKGSVIFEHQETTGPVGGKNYNGRFLLKVPNLSNFTFDISGSLDIENSAGGTISVTGLSYYSSDGITYVVAIGTLTGPETPISCITSATATTNTSYGDTVIDTTNIVGADGIPSGTIVIEYANANRIEIISQSSTYTFPFDIVLPTISSIVGWKVGYTAYVWPVKGFIVYSSDIDAPIRKQGDTATSPFAYYQWSMSPKRASHVESGVTISGMYLLDGTYTFEFANRSYLIGNATPKLPMVYSNEMLYDAAGWDGDTLLYALPGPSAIGPPPLINPV